MAKDLIPMDSKGMFVDGGKIVRVNSVYIAKWFDKRHDDVLKAVRKMLKEDSGLSEEFAASNFAESTYADANNQQRPCYNFTRDGFVMVAMGFNGSKAMKFKEKYITRFNYLEEQFNLRESARQMYPAYMSVFQFVMENPSMREYAREADMLNEVAIGCTAKEFKEVNNLPSSLPSIRPYLNKEQIGNVDYLQKIGVGILATTRDRFERKKNLEWLLYNRDRILPDKIEEEQ